MKSLSKIQIEEKEKYILELKRKIEILNLKEKNNKKKIIKNKSADNAFLSIENSIFLKDIFLKFPSAIIVTDKKGFIKLYNENASKLFGYSSEEFSHLKIEALVPKEIKGHVSLRTEYFKNPHQKNMGVGRDVHGLKKDGDIFPVEIGLNTLELGGEDYAIAVIIDLTYRNKIKEIINETNKKLVEEIDILNELLCNFSCMTCHLYYNQFEIFSNIKGDKTQVFGTNINKEEISKTFSFEKNDFFDNKSKENRLQVINSAWKTKKNYSVSYSLTTNGYRITEKGYLRNENEKKYYFFVVVLQSK